MLVTVPKQMLNSTGFGGICSYTSIHCGDEIALTSNEMEYA
jgi:hypothetical protein